MDIYAVFDGHGGKQAATFASRNLTDKLLSLLKESAASNSKASGGPSDLQEMSFPAELDSEIWSHWESQDKLTDNLPECLTEAFCKLQEDFFQQSKVRYKYCCPYTPVPSLGLVGWGTTTHKSNKKGQADVQYEG